MPSNRMLCDTVTLFNYIGEVDYKATYNVTVLTRVCFDKTFGARNSITGKVPADTARLYVFDSKLKARAIDGSKKTYLPYDEWKVLEDKSAYWTLNPDADDFLVEGETHITSPSDASKAYKLNNVARYQRGTKQMWHWEVDGI